MPSTYSSRFGFEKPATGEQAGLWGAAVNGNITNLVDASIDAVSSIAMADANQTLTIPSGAASPNRSGTLYCTGALTADRTLTVPAGDRTLTIVNATTGGFNIIAKNPSSGNVTVANGFSARIAFISANAFELRPQLPAPISISGSTAGNILTVAQAGAGKAILATGKVQITDVLDVASGSQANPSIAFTSDPDTGIFLGGTNELSIATGGVEALSVSTTFVYSMIDMELMKATPSFYVHDTNGSTVAQIAFKKSTFRRWSIQQSTAAAPTFGILSYDGTGALIGTAMSIDNATMVATFGAIPVGPASDPTTSNQLTRKAYVDAGDIWVKIADQQPTAVSSIDVTWTTGAYRSIQFILTGILPSVFAAGGSLYVRFRFSGVWETGNVYGTNGAYYEGPLNAIINTSAVSVIHLQINGNNSIGDEGLVEGIVDPGGASAEAAVLLRSKWSSTNGRAHMTASGICSTLGQLDGIRFIWDGTAGNFQAKGRILVMGLK